MPVRWSCAPLHIAARSCSRPLALAAALPRPRPAGSSARASAVEGAPVRPHTLLVANHTSWLDILVLGGATGCAFVSKDELGHGFIHWLADQNATVYVKRSQ